MRRKLQINAGDVFHKLVVIKEVDRVSVRKRRFLCRCECGNLKEVNLIHLTTYKVKSCGCSSKDWFREHPGSESPNWKGGRRKESSGYVEVYIPSHPKARANGYVKEHRSVMETYLGRHLRDDENVHHINGDKGDNRLENLELWNTSQPSGQRVADKIAWAKEILKLYGDRI
jgi:hypothetical protein